MGPILSIKKNTPFTLRKILVMCHIVTFYDFLRLALCPILLVIYQNIKIVLHH